MAIPPRDGSAPAANTAGAGSGGGQDRPRHLFEGVGIELEYMIVDRNSLAVRPLADCLLRDAAGGDADEFQADETITWSNELVAHVIELKNPCPADDLEHLARSFHGQLQNINARLEPYGACVLGTGAHPFMDPLTETRLWPLGYNEIYQRYNRIFDCRGHGWSNLQSAHVNLPFCGDEEFRRLHAAVRFVLPLLPALAASTPLLDGRLTGRMDSRLEAYRLNQRRIPEITGRVIPEAVRSAQEYHDRILAPMYRAVAPFDPEGILQEEWLNSRGAIARFERDAIEIRVIDMQECPAMDMALCRLITETIKLLAQERWAAVAALEQWSEERLEELLLQTIRDGGSAVISDSAYLRCFGLPGDRPVPAGRLWQAVIAALERELRPWMPQLSVLTRQGSLAERIVRSLGPAPDHGAIVQVYRQLARCLREGAPFERA